MFFSILFGASLVSSAQSIGYLIPPLTGGTVLTSKLDLKALVFTIDIDIELTPF